MDGPDRALYVSNYGVFDDKGGGAPYPAVAQPAVYVPARSHAPVGWDVETAAAAQTARLLEEATPVAFCHALPASLTSGEQTRALPADSAAEASPCATITGLNSGNGGLMNSKLPHLTLQVPYRSLALALRGR